MACTLRHTNSIGPPSHYARDTEGCSFPPSLPHIELWMLPILMSTSAEICFLHEQIQYMFKEENQDSEGATTFQDARDNSDAGDLRTLRTHYCLSATESYYPGAACLDDMAEDHRIIAPGQKPGGRCKQQCDKAASRQDVRSTGKNSQLVASQRS